MAAWDSKRVELLKKLWGDGLSTAKIAAALGGFEHCADGGRSAVIGQVSRLRAEAAKSKNEAGVKFWTRGKTGNCRVKGGAERPRGHRVIHKEGQTRLHKNVLPREKVKGFVNSIPPAVLKTDRTPLWKGAAFPRPERGNPDALTESELTALARAYE